MRGVAAINTPIDGGDFQGPAWVEARARLVLYTRALELPEAEAGRLVAAALEQARAAQPAVPVAAAMAALDGLLAQRAQWVAQEELSMPPLHRAPMVPEKLDRSPLNFFVAEVVAPAFVGMGRFLQGARRHRVMSLALIAGAGGLIGYL